MKIHQLQRSKGLKNKQVRIGRGNATGTGNYSGKGLKGQKSRSGHSMKPFFEGGQTSIVQRLPKARWFTRYYKLVKNVTIINLSTLDADARISDAMEITKALLKDFWYINAVTDFVKILGHGDYAKHLTFKDIDAFSASAKAKMENPGTVHAVAKKAPAKVVKPMKKATKSVAKKAPIIKETKKIETAKLIETTPEISVEKKSPVKKPAAKKPVEKKEPAVKKPAAKKPATKKAK